MSTITAIKVMGEWLTFHFVTTKTRIPNTISHFTSINY